ncbi:MAG: efflux RND transporter periplasmic adaptor subunit [Thermodesulfobacteriota bacterium]
MRASALAGFVTALLLGAFLALGGCASERDAADDAAGAAPQAADAADALTVTLAPVAVERVDRTVDFVGTLHADAEAEVATEVDGRLLSIAADLGDQVAEGQVLATLDGATLEAQLREATATLEKTTQEQQRARRLKEQGVMSQQEFEAISSAQNVALAKRDVLAIQLGHTRIRAPFAGRIAKRLVDVGNYVRVGTPIFVLVADDPLRLRGEVPERFAADLRIGQEVRGSVEAYPGEVVRGRLARVSAAADPKSRALTVEAVVPNSDGHLKVGFFCKAAILTRTDAQALVVPVEALVDFAGVTRVFVVDEEGTAHARQIETGLRLGPRVEIVSGLRAEERVATSALGRLSDGAKVQVRSAELGRSGADGDGTAAKGAETPPESRS